MLWWYVVPRWWVCRDRRVSWGVVGDVAQLFQVTFVVLRVVAACVVKA